MIKEWSGFSFIHPTYKHIPLMVQAFNEGFSDYILPVKNYKVYNFIKTFLNEEGYSLECSVLALDHNSPVGLLLLAVKEYEGQLKGRIGFICVNPQFRGNKIAPQMIRVMLSKVRDLGVKQILLEVLDNNERARRVYDSLGFFVRGNKMTALGKGENYEIDHLPPAISFRIMSIEEVKELQKNFNLSYQWKNDIDLLEKDEHKHLFLGAYIDKRCIGLIIVEKEKRSIIKQLWVQPQYRRKKIGTHLLKIAFEKVLPSYFVVTFYKGEALQGFFEYHGYKVLFRQYEMGYNLKI